MPMPMLPPAPARLSTTTCWPHASDNFAATTRAITSVGPPGANGTIMRTAFVGYGASAANVGAAPIAIPAIRHDANILKIFTSGSGYFEFPMQGMAVERINEPVIIYGAVQYVAQG